MGRTHNRVPSRCCALAKRLSAATSTAMLVLVAGAAAVSTGCEPVDPNRTPLLGPESDPESGPESGPEGNPEATPDVDGGQPEPSPQPTPEPGATPEPGPAPEDDGPTGFVGSPCESDADCPFTDGSCATDGYPRGTCTAACDRFCPDLDGHPTTFCAASSDLAGDITSIGDGACHARCDFGVFPTSGCRDGYGCAEVGRANEADTRRLVCLPGASTQISDCQRELAALGVAFEPTIIADRSPDGEPGLTCHVEDPVIVHPPIFGVDLVYYDGNPTPNITASCDMALALAQTADDASQVGVDRIRHIGTFNCRVIAGTSTLSRHSFGDAIDIFGFDLDDGSLVTLEDHWEHDTEDPTSEEAQFLYDAAHRWFDAQFWNIILTPNYNTAHDNHFHIDLTPESNFLGALETIRFIGPNPTGD